MEVVLRITKSIMVAVATLMALTSYAAGDAEAGAAQAVTCAACHGQDGATAIDPSYPNLAGQSAKYLNRQLQMFQSGERDVPLMTAQLIGKSAQDLENLAAYYASLPGKIGEAAGSDDDIKAARMIYKGGIADRGVAACAACHGPGGLGNDQAGFPKIGGQAVGYTIAQLTAYREGLRASDEAYGAMMRNVAAGLTDGQIKVLADYIHGLSP